MFNYDYGDESGSAGSTCAAVQLFNTSSKQDLDTWDFSS